jgi:hypothetical protein
MIPRYKERRVISLERRGRRGSSTGEREKELYSMVERGKLEWERYGYLMRVHDEVD